MNGATYTFGLSVVAALITTVIGVLVGTFAGISRGIRSSFLNHLLDITLSIPSLLLAIIIIAILGPRLNEHRVGNYPCSTATVYSLGAKPDC